jgi:prephenate dehydratase
MPRANMQKLHHAPAVDARAMETAALMASQASNLQSFMRGCHAALRRVAAAPGLYVAEVRETPDTSAAAELVSKHGTHAAAVAIHYALKAREAMQTAATAYDVADFHRRVEIRTLAEVKR